MVWVGKWFIKIFTSQNYWVYHATEFFYYLLSYIFIYNKRCRHQSGCLIFEIFLSHWNTIFFLSFQIKIFYIKKNINYNDYNYYNKCNWNLFLNLLEDAQSHRNTSHHCILYNTLNVHNFTFSCNYIYVRIKKNNIIYNWENIALQYLHLL